LVFRLETERLVIDELEDSDVLGLLEVWGDPILMEYYPRTYALSDVEALITRQRKRYTELGYGLWALRDRTTGLLLGDTGLIPQTIDDVAELEIGWHIRRDHRGQGLVPEAARACLEWAFGVLGRERMISLIRPVNVPSRRVAEKLRMTVEKEAIHAGLAHSVFVRGPF